MRVRDLMNRLNDRPFKAFRIHLSDGSSIPIPEPGMVIVTKSSAIIPTEFEDDDGDRVVRRWRTVSLLHMVQFSDLDSHISGKHRKKK